MGIAPAAAAEKKQEGELKRAESAPAALNLKRARPSDNPNERQRDEKIDPAKYHAEGLRAWFWKAGHAKKHTDFPDWIRCMRCSLWVSGKNVRHAGCVRLSNAVFAELYITHPRPLA